MLRDEFLKYTQGLRKMMENDPNWLSNPEGAMAGYLPKNEAHGYSEILAALAEHSYKIVSTLCNSDSVLDELAALLRMRNEQKNYKTVAYYFAISAFAVAMEKINVSYVDLENIDENELFEFDTSALIPENTDPITSKLLYYKNRLLDFSRNNQLVHFRQTKKKTLPLKAISPNKIFSAISARQKIYVSRWSELGSSVKTVLKCKKCARYDFIDYDPNTATKAVKCPYCDLSGNNKSMRPLNTDMFIQNEEGLLCETCGTLNPIKLVSNDFMICPECESHINIPSSPTVSALTALDKLGASAILSSINDSDTVDTSENLITKARNLRINFGLHAIYLACGFLDWKDTSGTEYHSPILMCRINLQQDHTLGKYYFTLDPLSEKTFTVNKTLAYMLSAYSKTMSIPLPEYTDSGVAYFDALRTLWENSPNDQIKSITHDWTISCDFAIGFFHYQKLQLEQDLAENREKYLAHPIIRRLCGDSDLIIETTEKRSDTLEHMVLDADDSQEKVIKAAQDGRSFILQGPPGSGKSQTITNIISVAIGEGKTVLFVTEKATARSIIVDNLSALRVDGAKTLANFVLDFDKFSTRNGAIGQRPLLSQINSALDHPLTMQMGYDSLLNDERYYKGEIRRYMNDLTDVHDRRTYQNYLQDLAPYLEYAPLRSLEEFNVADTIELNELVTETTKFYTMVANGDTYFDYRNDPLYGCTGATYADITAAKEYNRIAEILNNTVEDLKRELNVIIDPTKCTIRNLSEALTIWNRLPAMNPTLLRNASSLTKIEELQAYARRRGNELKELVNSPLERLRNKIDPSILEKYSVGDLNSIVMNYRNPLKRLMGAYQNDLKDIFSYRLGNYTAPNYESLVAFIGEVEEFRHWYNKYQTYTSKSDEDKRNFGTVYSTEEEWQSAYDSLERLSNNLTNPASRVITTFENPDFLAHFSKDSVYNTHEILQKCIRALNDIAAKEIDCSNKLSDLFVYRRTRADNGLERYTYFCELAKIILDNSDRIEKRGAVCKTLSWFEAHNALGILDELILKKITESKTAEGMLRRAFYVRNLKKFTFANSLNSLTEFNSSNHVGMMKHYAKADLALLNDAPARLYTALSGYMSEAGAIYKTTHRSTLDLPKIQTKTGVGIRTVIKENWDYIKHIKPCFMMSPLNASQYLDISMCFDMVIFDEASQIFTEDALASIVRGKQVIIAGDSKQLPPCDFFRAGGNHGDIADDDSYITDDEADSKDSLLIAADNALGDVSVSLNWHYRSYDEALIAFSNENFEYNLVTFPSAIKNPDDGIETVNVPYTTSTCYVSGKNGKHINAGEADAILELLWREICHPTRSKFSLGVVAFSAAQAIEIETRWNAYKTDRSRKSVIEAWEKAHENEPIIFCNLDTMQGDERDTMILSICYSADKDGKFNLTYLGSLRLPTGKKRLNVAITRSRHRMIVVRTLEISTLQNTISKSSAPDTNKEGAMVLCKFLAYADTFTNTNKPITTETANNFTKAICRALDREGIEYDTEIGRSECRISIGIKDKNVPNSYALGIIIDDPARTDFNSEREYARLTEQVLCGKYNWRLYRVFPPAWVLDYDSELKKLLDAIKKAHEDAQQVFANRALNQEPQFNVPPAEPKPPVPPAEPETQATGIVMSPNAAPFPKTNAEHTPNPINGISEPPEEPRPPRTPVYRID